MKYNFTMNGTYVDLLNNKPTSQAYTNKGTAEIKDSPCFKYGNQKMLVITIDHGDHKEPMAYDIRYDTRYSEKRERKYIETMLRENFQNVLSVELSDAE